MGFLSEDQRSGQIVRVLCIEAPLHLLSLEPHPGPLPDLPEEVIVHLGRANHFQRVVREIQGALELGELLHRPELVHNDAHVGREGLLVLQEGPRRVDGLRGGGVVEEDGNVDHFLRDPLCGAVLSLPLGALHRLEAVRLRLIHHRHSHHPKGLPHRHKVLGIARLKAQDVVRPIAGFAAVLVCLGGLGLVLGGAWGLVLPPPKELLPDGSVRVDEDVHLVPEKDSVTQGVSHAAAGLGRRERVPQEHPQDLVVEAPKVLQPLRGQLVDLPEGPARLLDRDFVRMSSSRDRTSA